MGVLGSHPLCLPATTLALCTCLHLLMSTHTLHTCPCILCLLAATIALSACLCPSQPLAPFKEAEMKGESPTLPLAVLLFYGQHWLPPPMWVHTVPAPVSYVTQWRRKAWCLDTRGFILKNIQWHIHAGSWSLVNCWREALTRYYIRCSWILMRAAVGLMEWPQPW